MQNEIRNKRRIALIDHIMLNNSNKKTWFVFFDPSLIKWWWYGDWVVIKTDCLLLKIGLRPDFGFKSKMIDFFCRLGDHKRVGLKFTKEVSGGTVWHWYW